MKHLTDEEILDVATRHCAFTGEGNYHLNKYTGWAIVQVVRDCFELAELCRQAEAAGTAGVKAIPPTASVERLMELVRTLPPRSMRTERNDYLAEIEAIAGALRDGVDSVDGRRG